MEFIKQHKKAFTIGAILYALTFLLIVLTVNTDKVNAWLGSLFVIFRPVLIGLVVAYLCNPFFRFYERKLFVAVRPGSLRRAIALLFTYLTLFAIVGVLLMLILPQLIESIAGFLDNLDDYLQKTTGELNKVILWLNERLPKNDLGEGLLSPIPSSLSKSYIDELFKALRLESINWSDIFSPGFLGSIFNVASNVFSILTDTLFGFFISLYLLVSKEKRYAQLMRARRAFLSDEINAALTRFFTTVDRSFGSFFKGKLIDSAIVGVLVYLVISLFNVPYAILIASLVAITDIIPVIGPFIGVLPSAVIIILTDPPKVIPFVLAILVIQQIDGNIIAPKILGEHTGVSSLCVIIAITTMGAIWGFVGMLLGVPLFATILELGSTYLDNRLKKKGLPSETKYYTSDTPEQSAAAAAEAPQGTEPAAPARRYGMARESLSPEEKQQLIAYAKAQKHRLFSEDPEKILEQYAPTETTETSENAQS